METKPELTKKLLFGVALILISLIIGKLVFIPIILFPQNTTWRISMIMVYAASWIMILFGIYLAGKEGYYLAKHKYHEYGRKTIEGVGRHSKNAAHRTVEAISHPVKHSKETIMKLSRRK
jgi:uncharacterized protein YacL